MLNQKNIYNLIPLPQRILVAILSLWAIASVPKTAAASSFATAAPAPQESLASFAAENFFFRENYFLENYLSQTDDLIAQATSTLRIEEIRGTGIATIDGRPVRVGSTLETGAELVTGENTTVRFRIEGRGGSIEVAEFSRFIVGNLATGAIDLQILEGRATFALPSSSPSNSAGLEGHLFTATTGLKTLEVSDISQINLEDSLGIAQNSGRGNYNFRVRTPTGVTGVRGTAFGVDVGPNGQTGVSTVSGTVIAAAQNQEQLVSSGQYAIISPNSPPTLVQPTPPDAKLKVLIHQTRSGNRVRVFGQVDRLDLVYINGQAIETDPDGNFAVILDRPISRLLRFVIRGPAIRERVYEIPVR